MAKQTKTDRISHDIYSYLKDWLNSLGIMVPAYVYMEIKKIILDAEKPIKKKSKKVDKLIDKPIDTQTQGWVNVIRNMK